MPGFMKNECLLGMDLEQHILVPFHFLGFNIFQVTGENV